MICPAYRCLLVLANNYAKTNKTTCTGKQDLIITDHNDDGIDRAGFIKCMA